MKLSAAKPVVVMSMHRSGSSFVASLLHSSGINMGSRLMAAGRDNPRGFFENLDFVEFHERWLRLNGYDRAGWAAPEQLQLSNEGHDEAAAIIHQNNVATGWGWKDPRTTLFADFWSATLPNASFILLYREPTEVIGSLLRRRDSPIVAEPELAARAWLAHNGMLLRFLASQRSRCLLANVAAVARDSRSFLQMIAGRFDLDMNVTVATTFDRDLMTSVDAGDGKFALLRYLAPECGHVFEELESKADIPGGTVSTAGPITARGARQAFFSIWLDESRHAAAERQQVELSKRASFDDQSTRSDARRLVSRLQRSLEKHRRSLNDFKHLLGEE